LLLYFWNTAQTCIDGNTPLLKAVSLPSHGSYDGIVRLLLENNADVHALNDRRTPLSLAACYSTETVVRLVGERIRYPFD
jgi:ankyrin repeat protein